MFPLICIKFQKGWFGTIPICSATAPTQESQPIAPWYLSVWIVWRFMCFLEMSCGLWRLLGDSLVFNVCKSRPWQFLQREQHSKVLEVGHFSRQKLTGRNYFSSWECEPTRKHILFKRTPNPPYVFLFSIGCKCTPRWFLQWEAYVLGFNAYVPNDDILTKAQVLCLKTLILSKFLR
jgi:hypothetical protein